MAELNFPWLRPLWQQWAKTKNQQGLPHGIGLAWEPHAGSEVLLDALVAWLLCLNTGNSACGTCKSCLLHNAGSHPDYIRIVPEDGKKIGIDRIRDLHDRVWQKSNQSGATVVVIQQAELMTEAAANALLKTLEEPPEDNYIIISPERFSRLLPTVRSRLTIYNLPRPSQAEIQEWLSFHSGKAVSDPQILSEAQLIPVSVLERLQSNEVIPEPLTPIIYGEAFISPEKPPEQFIWIDEALRSLVAGQRIAVMPNVGSEALSPQESAWLQCFNDFPHTRSSVIDWYQDVLQIKSELQGSGINGKILLEQFAHKLFVTRFS